VLEGLEVLNVVILAAFLNELPVKLKEDKFCVLVVPFEKFNCEFKDVTIKFSCTHYLKKIIVYSIF